MADHAVYLAIGAGGVCLAHVPELPGCVARAAGREEALARLPAAIRAYWDWLRRHGESVPEAAEEIELLVAGESHGAGPSDPARCGRPVSA